MVPKYELIIVGKDGYTSETYPDPLTNGSQSLYYDKVKYLHVYCGAANCYNVISFLKNELIVNHNHCDDVFAIFNQCVKYLGCRGCVEKIVCKDHSVDRKIVQNDQNNDKDYSRTCVNHYCKFTQRLIRYNSDRICAFCTKNIHIHEKMYTSVGIDKIDLMINNSMTHYNGVSGCQGFLKSDQKPETVHVCCECFTKFTLFGSEGSINVLLKSALETILIDPLINIMLDYLFTSLNFNAIDMMSLTINKLEQKLPVQRRRNYNLNSRGAIRKCSHCQAEMCRYHQFEQISYTYTYHNNGSIKSRMPQSNYICATCKRIYKI